MRGHVDTSIKGGRQRRIPRDQLDDLSFIPHEYEGVLLVDDDHQVLSRYRSPLRKLSDEYGE